LADNEAKLAAKEAIDMDDNEQQQLLSLSEVKGEIKRAMVEKWQHRWDLSVTGRHYHRLQPTVDSTSVHSMLDRYTESKANRISVGHTKLKEHLHIIGSTESQICECGIGIETVYHRVFECTRFSRNREQLTDSIERGYITTDTHPGDRTINLETLTGENRHLPSEMRDIIRRAFKKFALNSLSDV
jgi:hypothetical protein